MFVQPTNCLTLIDFLLNRHQLPSTKELRPRYRVGYYQCQRGEGRGDVPFSNGRSWHKKIFLHKAFILFIFEKRIQLFVWPIPDVGQHKSITDGAAGSA